MTLSWSPAALAPGLLSTGAGSEGSEDVRMGGTTGAWASEREAWRGRGRAWNEHEAPVFKRGRPSGFPGANHIAVGMVHYLYNVFLSPIPIMLMSLECFVAPMQANRMDPKWGLWPWACFSAHFGPALVLRRPKVAPSLIRLGLVLLLTNLCPAVVLCLSMIEHPVSVSVSPRWTKQQTSAQRWSLQPLTFLSLSLGHDCGTVWMSKKFYQNFQIPRHIESLNTCMKH
jgi:hypothetical protein